jgi:hypothetical protein
VNGSLLRYKGKKLSTLAYYDLATITAVKSFTVQTNAEYYKSAIFLTVIMTSVVMQSAVILSVVAPRTFKQPENDGGERSWNICKVSSYFLLRGAMTISIMTLSLRTLNLMSLSVITLEVETMSIMN